MPPSDFVVTPLRARTPSSACGVAYLSLYAHVLPSSRCAPRFTSSFYHYYCSPSRYAGKFGDDAWQIDAADALKPIASELGCSLAQLSIAWCLANPYVSCVLLGATTTAQLEENLSALDVVPKLTPDVMKRIAAAAGA